MTWPVVAIFAYLMIGLELSVKTDVFAITAWHGIAPSFVLPFVFFLALWAPPMSVYWLAFFMGLVLDLTTGSAPTGGGEAGVVVGPNALAMLGATFLVVTMRPLMNRKNPLTLVFVSVLGAAVVAIVTGAFTAFRGALGYGGEGSATVDVLAGLGSSLYTAVSAFLLALVLNPCAALFGFHDQSQRRFGRSGR